MSAQTPRVNFSKLNGFPDFEDDKIVTESFLDAANEVIDVIDNFSTVFYPIVKDMRNNSTQLRAFYYKDTMGRKYIEDLILCDESRASHSWLLWLKRALEMMERFFWHMLNDDEIISEKSDNLQPLIMKAYTEVLKPYHGFFLQRSFQLLYRLTPTRKSVLGSSDHFNENITHLKVLNPKMRMHINKIDTFLKENGFYDTSKV